MTAAIPRRSKPMLEKFLEKACTDFLVLDGWRPFKMEKNFSEKKRKSVGELGMADHLYIRYRQGEKLEPVSILVSRVTPLDQVLWIEFKRERGGSGKRGLFTKAEKAKIHQRAWIANERARGALVLLAGEDFEPTVEGFKKWYLASGLNRRMAA